jgi:DNA-binding Lrp family transcriptional regulator
MVAIGRGERDVLDTLLFGAILGANLANLNQDAELARTYASITEAPPDDLRRPVSINAVAQSLRLPFETARRRIRRMEREGVVIVGPRGVIVPGAVLAAPGIIARAVARHERLRQFYGTLRGLGALPAPFPGPPPEPAAAPIRVTNRALAEYLLRTIDGVMGVTGDPISTLVLLQMVLDNAIHLPAGLLAAWARDPAAHARPIRMSGLARRLRLPGESVRRHVLRLEAAGLCVRSSGGFCATAPASARPMIDQIVEANLANVQRLFTRLRRLGVLVPWDA